MGLTIHYTIRFDGTKDELVEALQSIRKRCLDLPFKEVTTVDLKEITDKAIKTWNHFQDNQAYSVKQRDRAIAHYGLTAWDIITSIENDAKFENSLLPCSMVSLELWTGEGCEGSNLAFHKRKRQKYWRCDSFCKTQYAEHFVRCHLLVIELLDIVKETKGFTLTYVNDEGEYWETRDIKVLAKSINEYTTMIKSIFGTLKENLPEGMTLESGIEGSENYIKVKDSQRTEK